MKFMLTFAFAPEAKGGRDEAIARFKKTGGQPPKGVKLLGRWTAADFSGGFDLLETPGNSNKHRPDRRAGAHRPLIPGREDLRRREGDVGKRKQRHGAAALDALRGAVPRW